MFEPSRLTLGTAQLGLKYGVSNVTGQPDESRAFEILDKAVAGGITTVDSARAYGTSEHVIGRWRKQRNTYLHVITKLMPLTSVPDEKRAEATRQSLHQSFQALGGLPIDLLLAHREADLLSFHVLAALDDAILCGKIRAYGASVSSVEGAMRLMDRVALAAIQVPVNFANQTFLPVIARASKEGIKVFARSVFLQGALLMKPDELPFHLKSLASPLEILAELSRATNMSMAQLVLLGVRDRPGITSMVIGIEDPDQLSPHFSAMHGSSLQDEIRKEIDRAFAMLPAAVFDPSHWPK